TVVPQRAIAGAINDLISVHDGHGHIDAIAFLREQEATGDKSLVGIGATLNGAGENAVIVNVIKGSPAEKYGLKRGDMILSVDDRDVKGLKLDQVVNWIRGEKGTPVRLQILRENSPQPITIVRDQVTIPNVDVQIVQDLGVKLAYIR